MGHYCRPLTQTIFLCHAVCIVIGVYIGVGEARVLYAISYLDINLLRKIALETFWLLAG